MAAGRFHAGVAELDITPPVGVDLAGDFSPRRSSGISTQLMAKALVLSNEERVMALVTLDLFGLDPNAHAQLINQIHVKTGIPIDAVMVLCSHTRGGPITCAVVGGSDPDPVYLDHLVEKVSTLVKQASQSILPASLGIGQVVLPHLVYNHRLLTRNQKAVTAWLEVPLNEVLAPEGPIDPVFCEVVIRDGKGFPLALLWNFAAESHNRWGDHISAGIPGMVQSTVNERLGRHLPLFYLPGCSDNTSFSRGMDESVDALASAVLAAYMETPGDPTILLSCASEQVILPVRDTSRFWCKADIEQKYPKVMDTFQAEIERMTDTTQIAVPTSVNVFRFGRYALAAIPGSPFVEFALEVKSGSPAAITIVTSGVGGDIGQVITRQAFDNGGFESWTSRNAKVGPGGGEFLAEQAAKLINSLWKGERGVK